MPGSSILLPCQATAALFTSMSSFPRRSTILVMSSSAVDGAPWSDCIASAPFDLRDHSFRSLSRLLVTDRNVQGFIGESKSHSGAETTRTTRHVPLRE